MKNSIKIYLLFAAFLLPVFGGHLKAFGQSDIAASPQVTHTIYRPQVRLTASDGAANKMLPCSARQTEPGI